jgi:hypothetical protein
MLVKVGLAVCLLATVSAWCQVGTNNAEANETAADDSQLLIPPPVSGQAYRTTFEGANESNYLQGGISFSSAYWSNVSWSTSSVSDIGYSVWPTIALDKTTYRMHLNLDYAPGFTLYQRTTSLNQADQNFTANLSYRLTPNLSATVTEGFLKTSNLFSQPNPISATAVSGSIPVSNIAIVPPLAETTSNTSVAQLTYQMSADAMVGGGGNYNTVNYPTTDEISGIYNSRSAGGSFFYSTRVHEKDYLGVSYQYQNFLSFQSSLPSTETQLHTIFGFFTMRLKPNWSVSIAGGPQHYISMQGLFPAESGWQPMGMVSTSWQGERTTVAASYAHTVGGGGGLSGTFNSNTVDFSFNRQISRNWSAGASGSYANYQSLTPFVLFSGSGGHTLLGAASIQRTIGDHANLQFGYSWTQQNYLAVRNASNNPNVNRVFVTLNFTFSRPLQR